MGNRKKSEERKVKNQQSFNKFPQRIDMDRMRVTPGPQQKVLGGNDISLTEEKVRNQKFIPPNTRNTQMQFTSFPQRQQPTEFSAIQREQNQNIINPNSLRIKGKTEERVAVNQLR